MPTNTVATEHLKGRGDEVVTRHVVLRGLTPIMFDRYSGDNTTQLDTGQKLYYLEDKRTLCLPSTNIMSFLSAENTVSAPRRLLGKKAKGVAQACLSFVSIQPFLVPFVRDGKPVTFGQFEGDVDKESGCFVHRSVARLKGGIPNPKVRPVLPLPWALEFDLTLYPNDELKIEMVEKLFRTGGVALGLGTWRGVFGKFEVLIWE